MRRRHLLVLAALLSCPIVPALAQTAPAAGARGGEITITQPWTRAAGANANGAGFLTLRNAGAAADRLVAASSPAARRVELHTHLREEGVMRMREVPAIELPPGQAVELRPGGLHLMLIGLVAALPQGGEVPVTLRFERAGEVQVRLPVQAAGARGPAGPQPGDRGH